MSRCDTALVYSPLTLVRTDTQKPFPSSACQICYGPVSMHVYVISDIRS